MNIVNLPPLCSLSIALFGSAAAASCTNAPASVLATGALAACTLGALAKPIATLSMDIGTTIYAEIENSFVCVLIAGITAVALGALALLASSFTAAHILPLSFGPSVFTATIGVLGGVFFYAVKDSFSQKPIEQK